MLPKEGTEATPTMARTVIMDIITIITCHIADQEPRMVRLEGNTSARCVHRWERFVKLCFYLLEAFGLQFDLGTLEILPYVKRIVYFESYSPLE